MRAFAGEVRLELAETQRRGHATELAEQAVGEGYDVIIALGGDGTVNEAVNGLLANGPSEDLPALAVVPSGSANVFARSLGLPNNALDAAGQVLEALRAGTGPWGSAWPTVVTSPSAPAWGWTRRWSTPSSSSGRPGPAPTPRCTSGRRCASSSC
ncbi:hypothetical protein GCM10029978_097660 [Actinoallomurus acanthiterrae]